MFSYLLKRNSVFYYRIKIPVDVLTHFNGKTHIVKSLKTRNLTAAKQYASVIHAQVQQTFALHRSGDYLFTQQPAVNRAEKPLKSPLLDDLVNLYIQDRSAHWSAKTTVEFTQYLAVLKNLIGNKPISGITRTDCIRCRERLQSLPPNFTKKKQYKGMSVKAIATSNNEGKYLSNKTVNKYLTLLSSFFKWCIKLGEISQNPSEGLLLSIKTNASEEREIYSPGDIQRIQKKLPKDPSEPEKYWIPMIAMYSGLRLDEICQLQQEDIQVIENIPCFNINASGGKHLKTASSDRIVPIHPDLISSGLLHYVDSMEGGQLWKNLKPDQYGRWGHKFGKWYGLFNRKEITDNTRKCFHSFRHTVANQLKQKGVKETLIAELIGHKNESITTGRYGKNYEIAILLDALSAISY